MEGTCPILESQRPCSLVTAGWDHTASEQSQAVTINPWPAKSSAVLADTRSHPWKLCLVFKQSVNSLLWPEHIVLQTAATPSSGGLSGAQGAHRGNSRLVVRISSGHNCLKRKKIMSSHFQMITSATRGVFEGAFPPLPQTHHPILEWNREIFQYSIQ